ncbi:hypothetical protein BACCELL_04929 [Bacteroides cellulosilyticus DSM 14838]|uniref:Uncharacterized protein n=1 Tax=Bacteroides cellulosilyticus DSM 14838 TaxID=537012 RepID=E2NKT6_9BACE|nr:hypothetical protein BACCELL_04929 [Bacteroides cellulosilyticus DSM 14838]
MLSCSLSSVKIRKFSEKNERYLSYFLHTGVIRITDLCLQLRIQTL